MLAGYAFFGKTQYLFCAAVLLSVSLGQKFSKGPRTTQPPPRPGRRTRREELYSRLLNQVLGDRQKAERLIRHAQVKHPGLSEERWIEIASKSLEGDIVRWD
jgi:hypothetical protein